MFILYYMFIILRNSPISTSGMEVRELKKTSNLDADTLSEAVKTKQILHMIAFSSPKRRSQIK